MIDTLNIKESDQTTISKQQLLIKSKLCKQNEMIAKQQLAVKTGLAHKRAELK